MGHSSPLILRPFLHSEAQFHCAGKTYLTNHYFWFKWKVSVRDTISKTKKILWQAYYTSFVDPVIVPFWWLMSPEIYLFLGPKISKMMLILCPEMCYLNVVSSFKFESDAFIKIVWIWVQPCLLILSNEASLNKNNNNNKTHFSQNL